MADLIDFKGSELEVLLKRAGRLVRCTFHAYTVRQSSTKEWKNIVVFEDGDKQEFCYAFEIDREGSAKLARMLLNGVERMNGETAKQEGQDGRPKGS